MNFNVIAGASAYRPAEAYLALQLLYEVAITGSA